MSGQLPGGAATAGGGGGGLTAGQVAGIVASAENSRTRTSADPDNTAPDAQWPESTTGDVFEIVRVPGPRTEYWTATGAGTFGTAPTLVLEPDAATPAEPTYLLERTNSTQNVAPTLAEVQAAYPGTTALNNGDNIFVSLDDGSSEWYEVTGGSSVRKHYQGTGGTSTLHNPDANRAPIASDDSTDGYSIGSFWRDDTTGLTWMASTVTPGSAVWDRIGEGATKHAADTAARDDLFVAGLRTGDRIVVENDGSVGRIAEYVIQRDYTGAFAGATPGGDYHRLVIFDPAPAGTDGANRYAASAADRDAAFGAGLRGGDALHVAGIGRYIIPVDYAGSFAAANDGTDYYFFPEGATTTDSPLLINMNNHGLSLLQAVNYTPGANQVVATHSDENEYNGVISRVIDANNVEVSLPGQEFTAAAHGLTDPFYFLGDQASGGAWQPAQSGEFPIVGLQVKDADTIRVLLVPINAPDPRVPEVTTTADMAESRRFYELTVVDGSFGVGLYYVNAAGLKIKLTN